MDQENLYNELVRSLALIIYARCVAHDDTHAEYEHFNDNRLGMPPDILARLGVMRGTGPNEWLISSRHVFEGNWTPDMALDVKRHEGEPTVFDLIVAVCLMVDWDRSITERLKEVGSPSLNKLPDLDLKDHRRFQSEPQIVFQYLAFKRAATCLEKLGLGEWNNEGDFSLISPLTGEQPIDLADSYSASRHLTAKRLGGVQSLFPT